MKKRYNRRNLGYWRSFMRPDWDSYFMKDCPTGFQSAVTCDRAFVGLRTGIGKAHPDDRLQWLSHRSAALRRGRPFDGGRPLHSHHPCRDECQSSRQPARRFDQRRYMLCDAICRASLHQGLINAGIVRLVYSIAYRTDENAMTS